MGLLDNGKGFMLGFVTGFGAGYITRTAFPNLEQSAGTLLKTAMRSGIAMIERSREFATRATEVLQDNWAEVQTEMEEKPTARRGKKKKAKRPSTAKVIPIREPATSSERSAS